MKCNFVSGILFYFDVAEVLNVNGKLALLLNTKLFVQNFQKLQNIGKTYLKKI